MRCIVSAFVILTIYSCYGMDTMTGAFSPRFKSIQVQIEGNEQAPVILSLNTDDRVLVSFDELAEERSYLQYSLVHCNADWQPSSLVELEYLDGFNVADVENYAFSEATTVHYVHYKIALPNEDMKFRLSGNYLLQVYPENEPDQVLLQARFSVSEHAMKVYGDVTSRTDIDYNDKHQQLSILLDTDRFNVNDVYNDIKIVVSQDGRVDNEAVIDKPMRVAGKKIYYEHLRPLIFAAGNEYRRMETVSMTYPGMHVEEVAYATPYYHQRLQVDRLRSEGSYSYDRTQFGRFKIREYNSTNSDVAADYAMTYFSLDMKPEDGYDVFLDGDFTYRRFSPESRMYYNPSTGMYEAALLLKQGAYNYQYLAVPHGRMSGETALVEGNYYQTVNEYVVKVYCRQPGERYDRLVAATSVYSGR